MLRRVHLTQCQLPLHRKCGSYLFLNAHRKVQHQIRTFASSANRSDRLTSSRQASPLFAQPCTGGLRRNSCDLPLCMRATTVGTSDKATVDKQAGGKSLTYTAFEGNSWQAKFLQSGVTALVDPWLQGDLVFGGQTWLYKGQKGRLDKAHLDIDQIMAEADVVLLSQGLDDHAHKPTLERMPKDKLVVGSPAAAAVAQELGFTNVFGLDHGKTMSVCNNKLQITGTAGALVGPPWSKRENGFILSEPNGIRLYYEPHCDYDEDAIAKIGKVDAIVTPANSQVLITFPLVKGKQNALKLIETLQPTVVIPLINAEFHSTGPLSKLIHSEGSPEELQGLCKSHGLNNVTVRLPEAPGTHFDISV